LDHRVQGDGTMARILRMAAIIAAGAPAHLIRVFIVAPPSDALCIVNRSASVMFLCPERSGVSEFGNCEGRFDP
jgi:hypothetical protein